MTGTIGDLLAEIWARATSSQPSPSSGVLLATAAVALAAIGVPALWSVTRHLLTIVHEGSHALAAVLSGRRLAGIRLHTDTSGLTVSVGRATGPGMVVTAFAGYVGPSVLGLAAAWLLARGYAVGLLWLLLLALVVLLLQIRNLFGLWVALLGGAMLTAVSWWAPPAWQVAVAHTLSWFLLLGSPRAVVELQGSRRRSGRGGGSSDADVLARLTRLPAFAWVALFWLVGAGSLVLGAWWMTRPVWP